MNVNLFSYDFDMAKKRGRTYRSDRHPDRLTPGPSIAKLCKLPKGL